MTSFYRTWMSVAVLLGINIAVRLFNIPIEGNLILGNHLVEAAMAFALVNLLIDLRVMNSEIRQKYFKIGIIAFLAGIFMVAASFSSLFIVSNFIKVTVAWLRIAPQVIFLIGVPVLYFADRLAQKNRIFGMPNAGRRGLINAFVIATLYSVGVVFVLHKYGYLVLNF